MVMLATAVELASYLKQDVDTVSAEQSLTFASAQVETMTGMAFTVRTATLSIPSWSGQVLSLPLKPVRSIVSASIGGGSITDYLLTASGLYRARGWRTNYAPQDIVITVQYGTTAVPDDIKGVVLEVAGAAYDGRNGVSSEGVDDYRVSYAGVLSHTSRATLAAYGADAGTVSMIAR